jgi:hypothetical protein
MLEDIYSQAQAHTEQQTTLKDASPRDSQAYRVPEPNYVSMFIGLGIFIAALPAIIKTYRDWRTRRTIFQEARRRRISYS